MSHEAQLRELSVRNQQLASHRDTTSKEVNDLSLQLRLTTDALTHAKEEHTPCAGRVHEAEEQRDVAKRELGECVRRCGDTQRESVAAQRLVDDLKAKIRTSEGERIDANRALQETRQQLTCIYI